MMPSAVNENKLSGDNILEMQCYSVTFIYLFILWIWFTKISFIYSIPEEEYDEEEEDAQNLERWKLFFG
jgi:hypothetical protein